MYRFLTIVLAYLLLQIIRTIDISSVADIQQTGGVTYMTIDKLGNIVAAVAEDAGIILIKADLSKARVLIESPKGNHVPFRLSFSLRRDMLLVVREHHADVETHALRI